MKSRKNTMKRGGAAEVNWDYEMAAMASRDLAADRMAAMQDVAASLTSKLAGKDEAKITAHSNIVERLGLEGGSKRKSRKSRKSRKTKKGRGAHEGGKKKCPKHCRRKTRRTRKDFKHHKN